ncbi:PTS sugar transporter subunit IIB, partial [Escherichia coli]|uniref:PTS sugar transporter subunit IIB n=1 Tax=Escherichia coli TaxID=562 RepID=UPI00203F812D
DRNRSHWSTSKTPSYTKSVSWQHHLTRPQDALAMVRQGVKIGTLNIGGMAWRPGKKQLTKAVSLDDDDINAFHELNNLGVILDLRVVASDPSINIIDKINEQLIAN